MFATQSEKPRTTKPSPQNFSPNPSVLVIASDYHREIEALPLAALIEALVADSQREDAR